MKKNTYKPVSIALTVLWIIYLVLFYLFFIKPDKQTETQVCIEEHCFNVQLAITQSEQQKGLMFVESMPLDEWMLFINNTGGYHNFWMKNTLINLDIIWINSEKEIIYIQTVPPCKIENCPSYWPQKKSQYILEINWWLAQEYGIQTGDIAEFSI